MNDEQLLYLRRVDKAWRTDHDVHWKLSRAQRAVYHELRRWMAEGRSMWGVIDCARRFGKDTIFLATAIEECLRGKRIRVPYAAHTEDAVKEILLPTADMLLEGCPNDIRPIWEPSKHAFTFPTTGSRLVLCGLDYRPDRLRGPRMHTGFASECAFTRDLRYVVQSIFVPMMQGAHKPFLGLNSTPPISPDHEWSTYFVPEAKRRGVYLRRTIFDNDRISPAQRAAFIAEAGGEHSSTHRRENMAEHVIDEANAVVPEFAGMESAIVQEVERPRHYDAYVSVDVGFHDLTVALFAYWDFPNARIVVEDEYVAERTVSGVIAEAMRAREIDLWSKPAYLRVGDAPEIVLADLSQTHNYHVAATAKDDKDAAVNGLRMAIANKQIVIHPRCETLRNHLRHAVWNRQRKSFERSGDFGHFDAVDAAVYLVRSVVKQKSPFPAFEGVNNVTHFMSYDARQQQSGATNALARALKPRWKR